MPRLPQVSGRQAVAAFEKAGFRVTRQRGSHIAMVKAGWRQTLSVPDHPFLRSGTLRALIRQAGLTVDEFVDLLR
jgi:predicted RNA binding protein YcfA (HicA-like mRNA interferase family)